jgi:Fic family protein
LHKKRWIWEQEKYPNFTYDRDLIESLHNKASFKQGKLSGYLSILDHKKLEEFKEEAIIDETMSTSAIEGDYLKRESVRDSIRKKLGDNMKISIKVVDEFEYSSTGKFKWVVSELNKN